LITREDLDIVSKGYVPIQVYDLGINFNGYPLEDFHSRLYENILDVIPQAAREHKNLAYKVILMQEERKDLAGTNVERMTDEDLLTEANELEAYAGNSVFIESSLRAFKNEIKKRGL